MPCVRFSAARLKNVSPAGLAISLRPVLWGAAVGQGSFKCVTVVSGSVFETVVGALRETTIDVGEATGIGKSGFGDGAARGQGVAALLYCSRLFLKQMCNDAQVQYG